MQRVQWVQRFFRDLMAYRPASLFATAGLTLCVFVLPFVVCMMVLRPWIMHHSVSSADLALFEAGLASLVPFYIIPGLVLLADICRHMRALRSAR